MPSLQLWIPFAAATLAFACMPGPAILYMTAQTVALGRRAGLIAAFGVHIGCYVHILAAAIGLTSLIEQAPMLFAAIKLAGAAYLVWLGLSMFMGWASRQAKPPALLPKPCATASSSRSSIRRPPCSS
ncbi:threonine/homoserine/homoserine lactone efflux protein [Aminobacter lissarensis]|uniref:Threonine/homoserine/homoserine lactone efflux protein n=1 Tax=Aminobacter carboxidus TaxID=376165 RepID=A0A8E1WDV6_9HYPH|nr:threonine/homoserine/homoserine lactone efflux protein [Aminobacter lissarensis]